MKKQDFFKLFDNINQREGDSSTDRILLIDGLNLFLRNFAVLNYINETGTHIGGLSGFLRSLGSLIKQINPTEVYVVFDGMGSSISRKNLIPEYKSGRNNQRITNWDVFENLDEEQASKVNQISRLIYYLRCLPIKIISLDRTEADDIIAYISNYLSNKHDSKCYIVSADKDFIQLINRNITVYRPSEKEFYTPQTVQEKFGILSENFIIYKTLIGDSSDKITGIKDLGPKTLLTKFPELKSKILSLDDIFTISEAKYKEHVIYSRIIFEKENLLNNFKVMDLQNPLIDDEGKEFVDDMINKPPHKLEMDNFLQLYEEDGLGHSIKNINFWLKDIFTPLNK